MSKLDHEQVLPPLWSFQFCCPKRLPRCFLWKSMTKLYYFWSNAQHKSPYSCSFIFISLTRKYWISRCLVWIFPIINKEAQARCPCSILGEKTFLFYISFFDLLKHRKHCRQAWEKNISQFCSYKKMCIYILSIMQN